MKKSKSKFYVNTINGERWMVPAAPSIKIIDGVEYLAVQKETSPSVKFIRKDILKPASAIK